MYGTVSNDCVRYRRKQPLKPYDNSQALSYLFYYNTSFKNISKISLGKPVDLSKDDYSVFV